LIVDSEGVVLVRRALRKGKGWQRCQGNAHWSQHSDLRIRRRGWKRWFGEIDNTKEECGVNDRYATEDLCSATVVYGGWEVRQPLYEGIEMAGKQDQQLDDDGTKTCKKAASSATTVQVKANQVRAKTRHG